MKAELKNAASVDTWKFAKNVDLAHLKSSVDKWYIDKLKNVQTNLSNWKSKIDQLAVDKLVPIPVDLSKLSDVVKNDVVTKDIYNAKIKKIEDKIPDTTNLATNASLNAKTNEVNGEIPHITNLATTTALTGVEYTISSDSNLEQKPDYNTKISEVENKIITDHDHDKYITTQEFDRLTSENLIQDWTKQI